jgi:hypothetical protein
MSKSARLRIARLGQAALRRKGLAHVYTTETGKAAVKLRLERNETDGRPD